MITPDVVEVLEDRLEFLEYVKEVAILCNWSPSQVEELYEHLLHETIRIDNIMFDVYDETDNFELASSVWEMHAGELLRWLQLILGVKIKFF